MKSMFFSAVLVLLGCGLLFSYGSVGQKPQPKFKIGLQLFSVRDAMAKDPLGTLNALKAMGYEDFETYGFDAATGTIYGYPVAEFKAILDELGLSTSS